MVAGGQPISLRRPPLAGAPDWAENAGMKRAVVTFCVCWFAWCGATGTNTLPLAYGMTPAQAEAALGEQLVYHSGRGGSRIYVAAGPAGIPGRCVRASWVLPA